ncbi:MAG: toprim domain-containing protein, partial [Kiritimatiellae bacterium]|nr:toprim domain-containing protein [Kiritimatiellia bacterium]
VEEPADVVTIESSGAFRGRYHVLGGKLSPVRRLGPEKLRVAELVSRIPAEGIKEVLVAVSTDMEGDATAGYLAELLKPLGVSTTRLAFGLPADSGVSYSDPLTLRRAIAYRVTV